MARPAHKMVALSLGLVMALAVLEVGLRIVPGVVSARLLILFEPELRGRLATGQLRLLRDFEPIERDDGGPPLYVRRPGARIRSVDEDGTTSQAFTDENGFCNSPGRYTEREHFDLIAIGDSFTWCHSVRAEQAWVYRTGEATGLEVYNLGQGGIGLYEYVQLLRRFGLERTPDVVVMNVYAGNDLRNALDYWDYRRHVERTGEAPSPEPSHLWPGLRDSWIGRSSVLVNLVSAYATRVHERYTVNAERITVDFRYSLLLEAGELPFNVENRDADEVVHARKLERGSASPDAWGEALERFASLAREQGFTPVLSYTPSAHTAYGDRVRFSDPELAPLLAALSERQRGFLAERADALGLHFHDFTDALRERAADGRSLLYDPVHIHLTPEGHGEVGASLARFLRAQGLTELP